MPDTPHPSSILRGHKAQVHALCFLPRDARLVSGDADGFVVVWDLTTLRPTAVWRPHDNAILGIRPWGPDRIITHGRDHKLAVWQLATADEAALSKRLPLDDNIADPRPAPWLLHMIEVNTMNFCTFASLPDPASPGEAPGLLVAVPNTLESESVDIYHLPSQTRRHTVVAAGKHGMVMALALVRIHDTLIVAAGYEDGHAAVIQLQGTSWVTTYIVQAHSQPVLSLDARPDEGWFLTSSADAVIAKHPLQLSGAGVVAVETQPVKVVNTKHAGQQGLSIRDDGRIFATGGWDAMVRVYSTKTLKEVAALKWHQVACYAVAIADVCGAGDAGDAGEVSAEGIRELAPAAGELSVRNRRIQRALTAHWLAAGSKDGKISLWEIF